MKFSFVAKIAAVSCIAALAAGSASACSCGASFHGPNNWEVAKLDVNAATVIFEGVPERFEHQWDVEGQRRRKNFCQ